MPKRKKTIRRIMDKELLCIDLVIDKVKVFTKYPIKELTESKKESLKTLKLEFEKGLKKINSLLGTEV